MQGQNGIFSKVEVQKKEPFGDLENHLTRRKPSQGSHMYKPAIQLYYFIIVRLICFLEH
jgi:hypothetical protein